MLRWLKRLTLLLVLFATAVALGIWWLLRGSLPILDGEVALPGLSAPVTVGRDALGVVTIDAADETDAMRALGYVHGQERFFEMDLMRRMAAGELSALFGRQALETDRKQRVHRMRARVEARLDAVAGERLPQLRAYAGGVNAGREALRVRPWPYLLIGQRPEAWKPADSALAGYAMYFDLQDAENTRELALWRMRPHLPPASYALLTRDGTRWDAPLMGGARGDAALPSAATLDLRTLPMPEGSVRSGPPTDVTPGSNNFAVAGNLTADGRAIVADDMHLGLRAPNIWFRARLRYRDPRAPGGRVDITGFTLPGLPAVVVGSNTHIAWGFTNSYIDALDWKRVRPCGDEARDAACDPVATHRERIAVADGDPVALDVRETDWGPILHREPDGSALALRWIAHLPGALNFGLADFAHARDLDGALRIANRTALPTQNLAIADRNGRIAWRLLGPIALRGAGCDAQALVFDDAWPASPKGQTSSAPAAAPSSERQAVASRGRGSVPAAEPVSAPSAGCAPWEIATAASPLLASPTIDRLWTANARVVDGAAHARIGDGGYAFGARARQIRDALFARQQFSEPDLLAIQLDDRAVFMARWWRLLRDVAAQQRKIDTRESDAEDGKTGAARGSAPPASALRALADAAVVEPERADPGSAAYRIVRAWRLAVHARIAEGLAAPAQRALGDAFAMPDLPQLEGVAWPLVRQRPAHLLPRRYACAPKPGVDPGVDGDACSATDGWLALFEDAAAEVREELAVKGPLDERTWGERNTAAICHPLAGAIPLLGRRLLCMPADRLPGDGMMPRVQGPKFGASERMVVSPGHEADGIAHMPGGQSGHPLSPFWGAGHALWAQGKPAPFLPSPPRHTLRMTPKRSPDG